MKSLIAYFSQTGHTRKAALYIARSVNADILEIKPDIPYTLQDLDGYNESSRTYKEQHDPSSRPGIKDISLNLGNYKKIIIGFPIWWYIAPRLINTFIETMDLTDKEIYLFATSYESTIEKAKNELKSEYSKLNFKEAKLLNQLNEDVIKAWEKEIES